MTSRETYVENMKLELDKMNDQLTALESKVTHARADVKQHYESELLKLRQQSEVALTQWEAMKAASEDSWRQWVSDMDHARDAFIHAFHDLKARL